MNNVSYEQTFQMRVTVAWLERIDAWRRQASTRRGIPSRADAVRLLVDRAIEADELAMERDR